MDLMATNYEIDSHQLRMSKEYVSRETSGSPCGEDWRDIPYFITPGLRDLFIIMKQRTHAIVFLAGNKLETIFIFLIN